MQTSLDIRENHASAGTVGRLGRTFRDTRARPVHRWFGYVEGFSADYLTTTLDELAGASASIYDPFGGAGTALLEASQRGLPSFFAEANPFMAFVSDTKVNAGLWAACNRGAAREALQHFRDEITHPSFASEARRIDLAPIHAAFANRSFFDDEHLRQLVSSLRLADGLRTAAPEAASLARLACAANIVGASHMTRRADLRRRKPDEYRTRVVDVPTAIASTVGDMLVDLDDLGAPRTKTRQVAKDCRSLTARYDESFDLAITSPPYLNGTNYVRNTKLELTLLGFVQSEAGLAALRELGICAGITQASTSRPIRHAVDVVEPVAHRLDRCAADRRIPHLVRSYFSDMLNVLQAVYRSLKPGKLFVLDIGDSKFYGIHVPTDRLLVSIAESVGFIIERDVVIARRHSRDKTPLVQVDLHLRKP
jgi:hypothetical protein